MSIKKIIGQEVKNKRLKMCKTQMQVAEETGISRSYISDVENGRHIPSVETLLKLATYFEIDLNILTGLTEKHIV